MSRPPRPEHREINPHADGVLALGWHADLELACSNCRPHRTLPVRYDDDPDTVVRCAQCGKKHSTNSLEVI